MSRLQLAADSTWELNAAADEIARLSADALSKLRAGNAVRGLDLLMQVRQTVIDLAGHYRHAVHHAEGAEAELDVINGVTRERD